MEYGEKSSAKSRPSGALAATFLPVALILLAAGLRLFHLGEMSLWYDEAFGVLLSRDGFWSITARTGVDTLPPLYYLVLYGWSGIGAGEFVGRMLSALFGIATVAALYRVAEALFDRKVGLAAGLIAAVSPFHVFYGQEIRMYALLGLLSALGVLAFQRAWETDRSGYWLGYVLASTAALYTHTMGAMTILALLVFTAADYRRARKNLRALAMSHLAIGILYLPWLYFLPAQMALVAGSFWAASPGPLNLLTALYAFTFGAALPVAAVPVALGLLLGSTTLAALLSARLVLSVSPENEVGNPHPNPLPLRRERGQDGGGRDVFTVGGAQEGMDPCSENEVGNPHPNPLPLRRERGQDGGGRDVLTVGGAPQDMDQRLDSVGRQRQSLLLVACWLLVPLLATFAVSQYKSLFLDRALISSSLALYVLLAWGFFKVRPRPVAMLLAAGVGALMALSLWNWYFVADYAKPPLREAAQLVGSEWQAGDVAVHTGDGSYLPFAVYLPELEQRLLWGDPELLAGTVRARSTVGALGIEPRVVDEAVKGARRVWLVVALDHSVEWQREQKAIFDDRFPLVAAWDFRGIGVFLYGNH